MLHYFISSLWKVDIFIEAIKAQTHVMYAALAFQQNGKCPLHTHTTYVRRPIFKREPETEFRDKSGTRRVTVVRYAHTFKKN